MPNSLSAIRNQCPTSDIFRFDPLYALPLGLVSDPEFKRNVAVNDFRIEKQLSALAVKGKVVGWSNHRPIAYDFQDRLVPPPGGTTLGLKHKGRGGSSWHKVDTYFQTCHQGYLGWLTSNPIFLEELNDLKALKVPLPFLIDVEIQLAVRDDSMKLGGYRPTLRHVIRRPYNGSSLKQDVLDAINEYQAPNAVLMFCSRWFLKGFVTWELPVPMKPESIMLTSPEGSASVGMYYPWGLPPLFADQKKTEFLNWHKGKVPALSTWFDALSGRPQKGRRGRADIGTSVSDLAQLFALRHLMRVLHQRHRHAMKGKVSTMRDAVANSLGIGCELARKLDQHGSRIQESTLFGNP